MKTKARNLFQKGKAFVIALMVYVLTYAFAYAQDGNAGINEATARVRSYFDTGTQLMYPSVHVFMSRPDPGSRYFIVCICISA